MFRWKRAKKKETEKKNFLNSKTHKTSVFTGHTKVWSILSLSRNCCPAFYVASTVSSQAKRQHGAARKRERERREKFIWKLVNQHNFASIAKVDLKSISNNKRMLLLWPFVGNAGKLLLCCWYRAGRNKRAMGMEIVYWLNKATCVEVGEENKAQNRVTQILISSLYYRKKKSAPTFSLWNSYQSDTKTRNKNIDLFHTFDIKMQLRWWVWCSDSYHASIYVYTNETTEKLTAFWAHFVARWAWVTLELEQVIRIQIYFVGVRGRIWWREASG